jgi:Tol biopolymer transport system component
MNENGTDGDRLDSWKSISTYLERDVSTLLRWEREKGLPVHRIPGGKRHAVYAFRHELDEWLEKPDLPGGADPAQSNGKDQNFAPKISPAPHIESTPPVSRPQVGYSWKRALNLPGAVLVVLLLVVAGYKYLDDRFSFRVPEFIGQQQLTDNGLNKSGLVTDGKNLFFGQSENGWYALAEMPVDGGTVRSVWSPPANVVPVDLSPDGRKLLAFTFVGFERERPLWIIPLDGGEPRRLEDVIARSASFMSDGRTIAYSKGEKIYLTSEDGSSTREIGSFKGLPDELHWSEDGGRLRFQLLDAGGDESSSSWELISRDGMKTITLRSLHSDTIFHLGRSWTRASRENAYFLIRPTSRNKGRSIWLAKIGAWWWESPLQLAETKLGMKVLDAIAFDPGSHRVFVLGGPGVAGDLVRYDPQTKGFREILPGFAGEFLDYSRDGQWIAFVRYGERRSTLWVSHADGSNARQLTDPSEDVQLPHWSPDGNQLAYISKTADRPWRIMIQRLADSARREASEGNDNQGAPTWSPDGRFLVYGTVQCQPTNTCAIRRIDLSTGKVQTLPGSEGLFTARWSPDGHWIAATRLEQHQIFLFEVATQRWRKLADAVDGTDLSWSANSQYLYVNLAGPNARIVRIRVTDGHWETVADLRSQNIFNLADVQTLGFSLAPDNSLILHTRVDPTEIYSYDLR